MQDADKILVLLQQGDEVLDYREAQRYYNGAALRDHRKRKAIMRWKISQTKYRWHYSFYRTA